MDTLPNIETERLSLRKLCADDIPRIIEFADNINVSKMTLNMPYPYREKDAIGWIQMANNGFQKKDHFIFAISSKTSNLFMGGIGLNIEPRFNHAELGFWIGEPFWNKGYVTEAVEIILEFGFEKLDLHKIYARHYVNNPASGKVMIKNGMLKEGTLVDHYKKEDQYLTLIQYRLTRDEFLNQMK